MHLTVECVAMIDFGITELTLVESVVLHFTIRTIASKRLHEQRIEKG